MAEPLPRHARLGLTPEEVRAHQRARLLAAVPAAMPAGGLQDLTVAMLVAEARISRRTFYELTTSVAQLVREAIDHQDQEDGVAERVRHRGDYAPAIARAKRATLGAIPPELLRVAVAAAVDPGPTP